MPARVTLTIEGQSPLVFEGRARCLVGRGPHCNLRVPNDEPHKTISRNQCLLDINPPDVVLRDFGSLNGTWHNGTMIGRRDAHLSPEEGLALELPQFPVRDGDEIRFGDTVLRIGVVVPAFCGDCGIELPPRRAEEFRASDGGYRCEECRARLDEVEVFDPEDTLPADGSSSTLKAAATDGGGEPPSKTAKDGAVGGAWGRAKVGRRRVFCGNCRADITREVSDDRAGVRICKRCRIDIGSVVNRLLDAPLDIDDDATRQLGRGAWEVVAELGRGGTGAVYQIAHRETREQVAIKLLLPGVAADNRSRELFSREIDNTRALDHRNIVRLRASGCAQGVFFFTMEYCEHGGLDAFVKRAGGRMPVDAAVSITRQILDGLEYAHAADIPYVEFRDGGYGRGRGLVHRDLKPGNILLAAPEPEADGVRRRGVVVKIGDFGVAKAFDTAGLSGFTPTGALWGTPEYMPRRLILDFKYARPDVDVWSAAATLYRMLAGRPPREFPKGLPALKVLLESAAVPIRSRQPDIPPRLAEVIDAALDEKGDPRYPTAAAFRDALDNAGLR